MTCPAPRHNQYAISKYGCICPDVRDLRRRRNAEYRKRRILNGGQPLRVPAIGAIRRKQALAWMGWPETELRRRILGRRGADDDRIRMRRERVDWRTDAFWREAFGRYAHLQGPSKTARELARARKWASPWAWENIDDPDCRPQTDYEENPTPRALLEYRRRKARSLRLLRAKRKGPEAYERALAKERRLEYQREKDRERRERERQGEAA